MSAEPSSGWSTELSSGSGEIALPRFSFVQQSENVNASKTRRAVRSHAMKAVRRQQRQENVRTFRLKWPEEQSSGKESQLRWPEEQSSASEGRQKRPQLERHIQGGTDGENILSRSSLLWPLGLTGKLDECDPLQMDSQRDQINIPADRPSEGIESSFSDKRQPSSQYIILRPTREVTRAGNNPRTFLSAGRTDPFQTYPLYANRAISELIDHYVTVMPAAFYGVRCRKPCHIELFRIAISHQASTHAMAAYASKSLDFLHCSDASQPTLDHTMRAVQGVNQSLLATTQSQDGRNDGVILSIAMLAFAELRFGRNDIARQHWIGLREVVRYRGGLNSIQCNHFLKAILAWNTTVWSASRYSGSLGSPNLPSLVAPETSAGLRAACDDFIAFFYKLNDSAYSHTVYSDPNDSSHTAYPYKNSPNAHKLSLFAPGTPLYRLLSPNPDSSLGLSNQRAWDACQMPCLLYINAVLLEYANGPYLIDDFFCKLINAVYEDNLNVCVSPEHLFVRLLLGYEGEEPARDRRLYAVTRLAYVAKRLGKKSMELARGALLRNLVLSDGPTRTERLFLWDPVVLEAEILRD